VLEQVDEAPLRQTDGGMTPEGDGWFVVNIAEAVAVGKQGLGRAAVFEADDEFPEYGINVHVIQPGEPNCMYHRENHQEDFLVLSGECVAIVEDQERPMRRGDFLHTPAGCAHVFVGAGDGPCAILMVGSRCEPDEVLYPVSAVAARHGASVERETPHSREAYARFPKGQRTPLGHVPW
jgi:uncharacterized cupin superfamily protein